MSATAVVGLQWGDEGKGKIVDFIAKNFEAVARFNGGSNAGHTVVVKGRKMTYHLLPSGALRNKKLLIGNGVLIDPEELHREIDQVTKFGGKAELYISDRAHVVLPFHKLRDGLDEARRGAAKIGTTLRGVGPCQIDKVARVGVRVCDLVDHSFSGKALTDSLSWNQNLITKLYQNEISLKHGFLERYATFLSQYMADTALIANQLLSKGSRILLEGAQGFYLDPDFGTYPYVTTTNTLAGYASVGLGIPPYAIKEIVGVVKAYATRVGGGPFTTELGEETGDFLRQRGDEYGATTRRPRRVGWFDAVATRYAAKVSGVTSLALTKLDVLSVLRKVKICKAYRLGSKLLYSPPPETGMLEKCEPVFEELDGWPEMREEHWHRALAEGFSSVPPALKEYMAKISQFVGSPVRYIAFGVEREDVLEISL